jgi:hypothetical protein
MSSTGLRNLDKLRTAGSTSRVLNLLTINQKNAADPDHAARPLFYSKIMQTALVLKHRLRSDETFAFNSPKRNATKIIIPLDSSDLKLGGRSFFVKQKGYQAIAEELLSDDMHQRAHDMKVLSIIDDVPSLDPFLMRETLRRHDIDVAPSHFEISPADMERMAGYVGSEIKKLIDLAFQGHKSSIVQTGKMVEALLANNIDEKLEPLRLTLRLEGDDYREGVFSWKGFLYYKWMLAELNANLHRVIKEMGELRIVGPRDPETSAYLTQVRERIAKRIGMQSAAVRTALKVYDDAYADLTDRSKPLAFREFLLKAPHMFLSLGEKIGVISHIASFWSFRFPPGKPVELAVTDAIDLFADFETSLPDDGVARAA